MQAAHRLHRRTEFARRPRPAEARALNRKGEGRGPPLVREASSRTSPFLRPGPWPGWLKLRRIHRHSFTLGFALALGAAACAPSENTAGGSGGATSGGGGTRAGTGGAPAAGSGGAGSGGRAGSGGTAGAPAGSGGGGGSGTGGAGSGGTGAGTGGAGAGTGGGGTGTGGRGTGGGAGAGAGTGGTAGGAGGGGGGGGAPACPAGATFCSGFEETGLPMGATYRVNAAPGDWLQDFALDTDVKLNGRASLRVKSSTESGVSSSAYKMLAVPATAGVFWVRFYIRSEIDMGGEHNPWAEASGSDDPNDALILEFAEDVGIAFNHRDDVVRPDGYSRENPLVLPKDTWYCIEIGFDSQTRRQQLFIDGTQRINAMNWPAQLTGTFRVFKFGFNQLHGPPRKTWFDDVAVAPQRIPCR